MIDDLFKSWTWTNPFVTSSQISTTQHLLPSSAQTDQYLLQCPGRFQTQLVEIQVFPSWTVTCWYLSVFLYWCNIYSLDPSKMVDDLPKVLNLNWSLLKLNWPICNFKLSSQISAVVDLLWFIKLVKVDFLLWTHWHMKFALAAGIGCAKPALFWHGHLLGYLHSFPRMPSLHSWAAFLFPSLMPSWLQVGLLMYCFPQIALQ